MCRSASAPFSAPSERGCRKGRWLAQQRRAPTPRRAAAGIVARAHASASRGKDPRGRSGAPWPRGGQPLGPRRAHSTARADKPRTTARDWARCRVFLSQHATDRLVTVLLVLLFASRFQSSFRFQSSALQSKGITASCGARHLNSSFTPPAVGGGADAPATDVFAGLFEAGALYTVPSRVCPNPSVAGQRSLGSRPTSDVLARGVRRHSHNQSTRNERATGAKRRADDVPTTEQGKQDTGDADYAHWTQKPDATAPPRGGLPLGGGRRGLPRPLPTGAAHGLTTSKQRHLVIH